MKDVVQLITENKCALISVSVIGFCLCGFRRYVKGQIYKGTRRMDGKTVLITGANTGIGKETAIDLAKRGARVIIACRDMNKGDNAITDIKQRSGSSNVRLVQLDLNSLTSVRNCAGEVNKSEARLDVLINNAGIMQCTQCKTEDGFEMQFGTNHLGHFLLTNLLLDLIKKSGPSRIVNVSSMAYKFAKTIDLDDIAYRKKGYNYFKVYAQSKLANILFTKELAKRLDGTKVTTYSLHPGAVDTELARHVRSSIKILTEIIYFLYSFFTRMPFEGAQTNIFCAVEQSLENETGKYYNDCREEKPTDAALDEVSAKKLWELSERLTGLQTS